jgi:hypothetical protein
MNYRYLAALVLAASLTTACLDGEDNSVACDVRGCCWIEDNGALACWGDSTPVRNPPGGTYSQIFATSIGYCAKRTSGDMECWGSGGEEYFSAPTSDQESH